jgi:anti-sigma regulatory factor (Ser/Thr protein kinase)
MERRLEAGPDAAAQALDAIEEVCQRWGVTDRARFHLQLAVDEAVSNIVRHGYGGGPGPILLRMGRQDHDVWVELRDEGRAFDPTTAPSPPQHEAAERPIGGLGIHLMRQVMDEVTYRREGKENILRLVKRGAIP